MSILFTHGHMQRKIPEEIKAVIFRSDEPWFPDLSKLLAEISWEKLFPLGIVPDNYGTHRCLEKNPATDLQYRANFNLGNELQCQIEILPLASQATFENAGLKFPQCTSSENNVPILQSALSLVAIIPSLYSTVTYFLRSLHVLEAPNKDYDVSHSDPNVPFSIFVSIPPAERHRRLRLAESIVHECMHLQLTAFETLFPLVNEYEEYAYSPWQMTVRPLVGVIHGLYVFTVIHSWFEKLTGNDSITHGEQGFLKKRQGEIVREMAQIVSLDSSPGLTGTGRDFIRYLLQCVNH